MGEEGVYFSGKTLELGKLCACSARPGEDAWGVMDALGRYELSVCSELCPLQMFLMDS